MSLGATDRERSLFLKGFKLSKQGNYEDPTYLGFKIVFDFGTLPISPEDGMPPSPLFRDRSYFFESGGSFAASNPFCINVLDMLLIVILLIVMLG